MPPFRLILLLLLVGGCVRTGEQRRPIVPRDGSSDRAPGDLPLARPDQVAPDRPTDTLADRRPGDARRPDATPRTQTLTILVTGDDGQISAGQLLPAGEVWLGNLIHVGSWATAASGGPTLTHAYLRFRLGQPLPAGSTIAGVTLEVYGHALTVGSKWDPQKHMLVISADRSASAVQVTSPYACPGCAKGAPQTVSVGWSPVWKADAWNATPNLAAIVQELVDAHAGLEAGAHLQLWLRAPQVYPEDAEVPFDDLERAGGKPARLTLSWLEP